MAQNRRHLLWLIPVGLLLILLLGGRLFDVLVRGQLERAAQRAAGDLYQVRIGGLRTDLWRGSAMVKELHLWFDTLRTDSLLLTDAGSLVELHAESIRLEGLSYSDLFFDGAIRIRRVKLDGPRIAHFYHSGTEHHEVEARIDTATLDLPEWIRVDSLIIRDASARTTDVIGRRTSATMQALDLWAGDISLYQVADDALQFHVRSATLHITGVDAGFPPLYDLHIDTMHLEHPSGTAIVSGAQFLPRADQYTYQKVLKYETDLFQVQVDSIWATGLNVGHFLAFNIIRLQHLHVARPVIEVYRDKAMPDEPFRHKPLPTRLLRELGMPLRIDSISIADADVRYHERDITGGDYGMIAFEELEGSITGILSPPTSETRLEIKASGRVYGQSTVFLTYGAQVDDPRDAFSLSAYTTQVPFEVFNRMTDSLLRVEATAGNIHRLDLRMTGDDHTGRGTIDLEYEDLRVALQLTGRAGEDRLIRSLANLAVRSHNLPDRNNYRQGIYNIDRRRDRSLFNFMWQAVKAGTIDTMSPGIARGLVRQATGQREPVKREKRRDRKSRERKEK